MRNQYNPDTDAPLSDPISEEDDALRTQLLQSALDLLEECLNPDCTLRITPRDALRHPFLAEEGLSDDDFFPHPPFEGICSQLHFRDAVSEEHWVRYLDENGAVCRRPVGAGSSQAIGHSTPCSFHAGMDFAPVTWDGVSPLIA